MLVNRTVAPFDNADLRRAMALTLDRKSFIDILGQGEGEIGGALMPPPDGVWGMPPDLVQTLPGYTGDVQKNREEARALIQKAGYGPDKRLSVKISTRNLAVYRARTINLVSLSPELAAVWDSEVTIMPMPRHRIPILIAAPFPSRSPLYKSPSFLIE